MKTKLTIRRPASALAISLIMALLLLTIGAASMTLTTTNFRTTNASFSHHAMQPVGEAGLDQAVKALSEYIRRNRSDEGFIVSHHTDTSWGLDGWNTSGAAPASVGGFPLQTGTLVATKDFLNLELGDKRLVTLRVNVFNIPTENTQKKIPYPIFAVAEVKFDGNTITTPSYTRQFLAVYSPMSSKGPGMIAINQLTFTGSTVYVSAYDATKGAPFDISKVTGPASLAGKNAYSDVTIATFDNNDIPLGQVNVFGYVSVGPGKVPNWAQNAHIWDSESPNYRWNPKGGVDGFALADFNQKVPDETPNINDNFTDNIDDYKYPKVRDDIVANINANTGGSYTTLPAKTNANTISINKKGVISPDLLDASLVTGGVYYLDSSLKITSTGSLAVKGKVTLIVGAPSDPNSVPPSAWSRSTPIDVSGQGGILMLDNTETKTVSKLQVYTASDVSIGGNSIMGTGIDSATGLPTTTALSPDSLLIAGTYGHYDTKGTPSTSDDTPVNAGVQKINLAGNGAACGTVNAPLATLSLSGGGTTGSLCGSAIAYNISTNGTVNFYYDINQAKDITARFRLGSLVELKNAGNKVTMIAP